MDTITVTVTPRKQNTGLFFGALAQSYSYLKNRHVIDELCSVAYSGCNRFFVMECNAVISQHSSLDDAVADMNANRVLVEVIFSDET